MNASSNQNGIMWLTINANTRGNHYRTESDMETGEVFYIRNDYCEPKIITPEKKPSNKEAEMIKEWWENNNYTNLKKVNWVINMNMVVCLYKCNEAEFNKYGGKGFNGNQRDNCEYGYIINKMDEQMNKPLAELKRECRRKGIKGISGKKKWALVNHMIEYDTGFDIYFLHKCNYLYEIYEDLEYKPAHKKCMTFPYNIICCDPYTHYPW